MTDRQREAKKEEEEKKEKDKLHKEELRRAEFLDLERELQDKILDAQNQVNVGPNTVEDIKQYYSNIIGVRSLLGSGPCLLPVLN